MAALTATRASSSALAAPAETAKTVVVVGVGFGHVRIPAVDGGDHDGEGRAGKVGEVALLVDRELQVSWPVRR